MCFRTRQRVRGVQRPLHIQCQSMIHQGSSAVSIRLESSTKFRYWRPTRLAIIDQCRSGQWIYYGPLCHRMIGFQTDAAEHCMVGQYCWTSRLKTNAVLSTVVDAISARQLVEIERMERYLQKIGLTTMHLALSSSRCHSCVHCFHVVFPYFWF